MIKNLKNNKKINPFIVKFVIKEFITFICNKKSQSNLRKFSKLLMVKMRRIKIIVNGWLLRDKLLLKIHKFAK